MNYTSFIYGDSRILIEWKGYRISLYVRLDDDFNNNYDLIKTETLPKQIGDSNDARIKATAILDAYEEELFNKSNNE